MVVDVDVAAFVIVEDRLTTLPTLPCRKMLDLDEETILESMI